MHLWVYQRSQGEDALAWQSSSTAALTRACRKRPGDGHEGIAEWATHQLHRVLFGVWPMVGGENFEAKGLPFTACSSRTRAWPSCRTSTV